MNADLLTTCANDLLRACSNAYDEIDDAPDRPALMYVTHGPAIMLGDLLAVSWTYLSRAAPFPQPGIAPPRSTIIPAAEFVIECNRGAWPVPAAGAARIALNQPDALEAAAAKIAGDATTVFFHVCARVARGDLFPSFPTIGKGDITIGQLRPSGPSGQNAGWRWPIEVKLTVP